MGNGHLIPFTYLPYIVTLSHVSMRDTPNSGSPTPESEDRKPLRSIALKSRPKSIWPSRSRGADYCEDMKMISQHLLMFAGFKYIAESTRKDKI